MLVSAKEMLEKAKAGHYAVGPVSYTHLFMKRVKRLKEVKAIADGLRTL